MSILSIITLGSSVSEMMMNLILAGVLYVVGHYCFQLVTKINAVHEYMISATEEKKSMEKDISRLDHEVQKLDTDLKEQIKQLDHKFDRVIAEMKQDRLHG